MYVRIRKDLSNQFKFTTNDGIEVKNNDIYPAKYFGKEDEFQIFINGKYRAIEGIDFDILDNLKFDVLSPDGFAIHHSDTYKSPEAAYKAIELWAKNYERQGYYSSCGGRIDLRDLKDYCKIIPIENHE